jgi:hypothetical protein
MGEETVQTGDRERDEERSEARVMVPVKVIDRRGGSALVEWEGPRRGYLPADVIEDSAIASHVLAAAIPYGTPWEELAQDVHITSQAIADALRNAGIWTVEDMELNVVRARKAIRRLIGNVPGELRRAARRLEEV